MEDKELLEEATSEEQLAAVEQMIKDDIDKRAQANLTMNRAQRRAFAKKMRNKKVRENQNTIIDTAKKLDYIELIQKLRELNEKKEQDNNEEDQ